MPPRPSFLLLRVCAAELHVPRVSCEVLPRVLSKLHPLDLLQVLRELMELVVEWMLELAVQRLGLGLGQQRRQASGVQHPS